MESDLYVNFQRDAEDTTGPQTPNNHQDEGKAQKCRGSCLVLMTVCLGIICVVLLVFITLFIIITADRDLLKSYKNTVEEFNHTINRLQDKNTDLMTEKDQLKNNFNSLSQTKLELETRVNDLTAEKSQLQKSFDALSQTKLELETRVNDLTAEKSQLQGCFESLNQTKLELEVELRNLSTQAKDRFFICSERMSWSESRQYCRDRGADLVIINTEEKQSFITSLFKDVWFSAWIGLSDSETEGIMKWVDNSHLNQGFWYRGEPNNFGGDEDCIELHPGRDPVNNWNDAPCYANLRCICEK
ncbi:CD209 antigen [Pimephales promelas]|nr:CD209 antigen [Pimephales promelas]